MPQTKPVKNLQKICLISIAKNMDQIWCKDYLENYAGHGLFLYIDGPFDCLPGSLVSDIIETLKEEHLLRRNHLQLLITSHLNRLDVSKENINLSQALTVLSFRCKDSLKELNVSHCTKLPLGNLKDALVCLENLEILDLSYTGAKDDVLGALGANCPKLRDLNVTFCTHVSDDGIKYLCEEDFQRDPSAPNGVFGKCKLLSRLIILDTRVTSIGIEAALRNLPQLTVLNHPLVVTVLAQMHQKEFDTGLPVPKYSLISLTTSMIPNNYGSAFHHSLNLAVELCPNAKEVHLSDYRYNECPDALLSLHKVRKLEVFNLVIDSLSEQLMGVPTCQKDLFTHGIIPILQTCGQSITTLSLAECSPYVDIGVIGHCCPAISDLSLAFNSSYTKEISAGFSQSSPKRNYFQRLKKLNFVGKDSRPRYDVNYRRRNEDEGVLILRKLKIDLPDQHMKDLLSSPVLESIFIYDSTTLSDSILSQVLVEGQKFMNLRLLELENCHNVTSHFIHSLLHLSGPLKYIKLWSCKKITRSDLNSFKSLIKRHKWDLSIDWM